MLIYYEQALVCPLQPIRHKTWRRKCFDHLHVRVAPLWLDATVLVQAEHRPFLIDNDLGPLKLRQVKNQIHGIVTDATSE